MSREYKAIVAGMSLTDALPELAHPQYDKVRELDALRVKLAEQYEAQDGALLQEIERILKHDGTGNWTRYMRARVVCGSSDRDRLKIASGIRVPIVRFDSSVAGGYARRHGYRPKRNPWDVDFADMTEAEALRCHGFEEDARALEQQP